MACFGVLLSRFHSASVANEVAARLTSATVSAPVKEDCHESSSPFLVPTRFSISSGLLLAGAVALVLMVANDARAATWPRMAIINNSTLNGTSVCDWNASGYLECPVTNPAVVSDYVGIGSTGFGAAPADSTEDRAQNNGCGVNVDDALKRARASLDGTDPSSERVALQCLIDAVSELAQDDLVRKHPDGSKVLELPQNPGDAPIQYTKPHTNP